MGLETGNRLSPAEPGTPSWAVPPHLGIRRALAYMRVHCNRRLPLAEVASIACMSQFHFSRLFRRTVGVTFQGHLVRLRLRNADQLIRGDPSASLGRVAAETGFGTLRNLQDHYRRCYGYSPSRGRARMPHDAAPWGGEGESARVEHDAARTADVDRQVRRSRVTASSGGDRSVLAARGFSQGSFDVRRRERELVSAPTGAPAVARYGWEAVGDATATFRPRLVGKRATVSGWTFGDERHDDEVEDTARETDTVHPVAAIQAAPCPD